MSLFPIKLRSFGHLIKLFDLGDKVALIVKTEAGEIPMLVCRADVEDKKIGITNSIAKYEVSVKNILG